MPGAAVKEAHFQPGRIYHSRVLKSFLEFLQGFCVVAIGLVASRLLHLYGMQFYRLRCNSQALRIESLLAFGFLYSAQKFEQLFATENLAFVVLVCLYVVVADSVEAGYYVCAVATALGAVGENQFFMGLAFCRADKEHGCCEKAGKKGSYLQDGTSRVCFQWLCYAYFRTFPGAGNSSSPENPSV